jgi:hypothetical protein
LAPRTTVGRWAVGLSAVAAVAILLSLVAGNLPEFGGGFAVNFVLPLGMVGGFAGAVASVVALFRRGDRAILVWLAFVLSVLIALFWIAFIIGEAVFPH